MKAYSGYTVPGLYADSLSGCYFIFAYLSKDCEHTVNYVELDNLTFVLQFLISSIHNRHIDLVAPADSIEEVKLTHPELFL